MTGSGSPYNNEKWQQVAGSWSPAKASTKQLWHYGQMMHTGKFQEFDYGDDNISHYGKSTVPELSLSHVSRVPVAMFVGKQDPLANTGDCQWVRDQMHSVVHYQELDNADHGTFMGGKDMSFFSTVLDLIAQHAS